MTEESDYKKAKDEFTNALIKYSHVVDNTNHVVLGGTVVWESSVFDEDGTQIYYTHHAILGSSSLAHAAGLLAVGQDRLTNYINTPREN
jgi:hypothetical protein